MSSLRPTQTRKSLLRPRPDRPCIRGCGRMQEPGLSHCRECRNEMRRARRARTGR